MPFFSQRSLDNLASCHPELQRLAHQVINFLDCSCTCGYRGEAEQEAAFSAGASKEHFPNSKHNRTPSLAMDLVPYIEGKTTYESKQAYFFAGQVMMLARFLGIKIRGGADWDGDGGVNDQRLHDPCHFEYVG